MTEEVTPTGQEPNGAQGQTPTAPQTNPAPGAPGDKGAHSAEDVKSLPEWAQKLVRDLRKENGDHRTAKADAAAAAAAAEEKRLADEKQWQTLAEKRGAEIETLKAQAAEGQTLKAQMLAAVKAEVEKWPEDVRALLPAEEDAVAYLAAVEKARGLVRKLDGKPQTPGNPGNPPGAGAGETAQKTVKTENARFVSARF